MNTDQTTEAVIDVTDETAPEPATPEGGQTEFIVDEATDQVLRLHLDTFQGPLEVLLYLIKAQELDIFDIPIATITEQYMKFLDLLEEHQLEVAGDYLVMAATLIQIKSKMLIPADIDEDDEEEIEEDDPRLELVEKLIQYRMYRDVAQRLSELEAERLQWFTRNVKPDIDAMEAEIEDHDEDFLEVSLFDLAQAFKGVVRFLHEDTPHMIELEGASVDEKVEYIQTILEMQASVAWTDLFRTARNRVEAICCFLAILELCRMEQVTAHQHGQFGDIRLFKKAVETNAA